MRLLILLVVAVRALVLAAGIYCIAGLWHPAPSRSANFVRAGLGFAFLAIFCAPGVAPLFAKPSPKNRLELPRE